MEDIEVINLYWETLPLPQREEISRLARQLRHHFKELPNAAPFGEASAIEFLYRLGLYLNRVDPDRVLV